jgi:hypothetical protein
VALNENRQSNSPQQTPTAAKPAAATEALPFDEEAKLVYGVVLSLRNMIKKLSGRCVHFSLSHLPHFTIEEFPQLETTNLSITERTHTSSISSRLRRDTSS